MVRRLGFAVALYRFRAELGVARGGGFEETRGEKDSRLAPVDTRQGEGLGPVAPCKLRKGFVHAFRKRGVGPRGGFAGRKVRGFRDPGIAGPGRAGIGVAREPGSVVRGESFRAGGRLGNGGGRCNGGRFRGGFGGFGSGFDGGLHCVAPLVGVASRGKVGQGLAGCKPPRGD